MYKKLFQKKLLTRTQRRGFARYPYEKAIVKPTSKLPDPFASKNQEEIFEINSDLAEYNFHEIETDINNGQLFMGMHRLDLLREKIATHGEPVDAVYVKIILDRLKIAREVRDIQTFFVETFNLEKFLRHHQRYPVVLLNNANLGMNFDYSISMKTLQRFANGYLAGSPIELTNIYFNLLAVR
jgi:hypothetical protein